MSLHILSKKLNNVIIDEIWPVNSCPLPQVELDQDSATNTDTDTDDVVQDNEVYNMKTHMLLKKKWSNHDNCLEGLLNAMVSIIV